MRLAPVALFAYRRSDHLARTLDALEACPEFSASSVTVYSDGPRSDDARPGVAAVRTLLASRKRANMTIVEAPANRGLANSIISGVTEQCERHGRVIVIEDDLVLSPVGLTWLNRGLNTYADDARVWQVGAHQFAVPQFATRADGLFLRLNTSWGWGTWKRAWDRFDPFAIGWQALKTDSDLRRRFNLDGAYPYAEMMEQQMTGKVDSWAIRWWWSVFQANGLGLHPPRSLVSNIGDDGSATHAPSLARRLFAPRPVELLDRGLPGLPSTVAVDQEAQRALETLLRSQTTRPRWKAVLNRLGF
jgi:hypothetical protein